MAPLTGIKVLNTFHPDRLENCYETSLFGAEANTTLPSQCAELENRKDSQFIKLICT